MEKGHFHTPYPLETLRFVPKESNIRHVTSGEMSEVHILDEAGLVVKFPRNKKVANHANLREALIVAELQNRHESPLVVPCLRECGTTPPFYSIFEKVEGVTLDRHDVEELSTTERDLLGRKLGAFVAWMTTALRFDAYQEILGDTADFTPPNRSSVLRERRRDIAAKMRVRDAIGHLICELWDMHESLRENGVLDPTVIGHTDLHLGNITFVERDGMQIANGVIDFGVTQLTTPESDLRHAAILGEDIGDAAIEEYEKITGERLNRELIGFWAIVQVASACAYADARELDWFDQRYQALQEIVAVYGEIAGLDPRSYGRFC